MNTSQSTPPRQVMVIAHTGRETIVHAAEAVVCGLVDAGIEVIMLATEAADISAVRGIVTVVEDFAAAASQAELVLVLGGDGTILRAVELVGVSHAPVLGMNFGHVGFLADSDREDLAEVVRRVATASYFVEQRMSVDVVVRLDGQEIHRSFALNEATVEKVGRKRMLEVVTEIDGRPVSSFGCDGVVMATPTGSTAYAFSAGGPVVWPDVEALLLVPICAHALFARPMVVSPDCALAVELLAASPAGVLVCDGRRTFDIPPGARVEVTRGASPVRFARLLSAPFTDRLVAKFRLPVSGWRGPRVSIGHPVGEVLADREREH